MNDNRSVFYRAINKIYGNKSDEFLDEVFVVSLTKLWEKITNRAIIQEQLTVPLKDYLIGFGKLIAHEVEKQYNPIKKNSQKTCYFFCPSCGNEEEITLSKFTKDGSRIPCCVCGTKMIVDVEKEVRSAGCEYGSSMDVEKMPSDTPQDITQQIRDALFDGQRLNDLMWEAIDRALKQMRVQCQQLLDMVYPIGSLYMSMNTTDPSELFGGTWERIKDRFIYANGDTTTPGTLGGSTTHNHGLSAGFTAMNVGGGGIQYQEKQVSAWGTNAAMNIASSYNSYQTKSWGISLGGATDNANTIPPYITAYIWKRIA
jgi:transcription elongation factor Elf1